ncbi:hypothetical protein VOLCADRAFT_59455 [Volvox carteri f. nagariensis]|uniref:Uncharacterized protein n=1 Tax=Volvox carteri f. nagariensis TaxID=3068 RepID=D8TSM8_VOLCA|nr:uncharacterized protein VOLCADRAFT_59455 [Volvox carteri f. nagariensis]EFJ49516.1 hypothetical protein VOLCADRAFT_59455 [Volvox carteri f. nagariensis]|eukprot:XP_002949497.1 hypothetical protein VOLCADRAFT_59455 [Volvox carteri f. nagariensis]
MRGYQLQIEGSCGWCDDTALNGLRLRCEEGNMLSIQDGNWGGWSGVSECASGYLTAARLKLEGQQGGGDDTAANSIQFRCSNGQDLWAGEAPWGG